MSEQHTAEAATDHESRMMKAIVRDITIALPVALILVTVALMVFADNGLGTAVATAVLPGVLIGVFFGGFSGTARTMD
jgi:multidrug efflux pump subunit AcrB